MQAKGEANAALMKHGVNDLDDLPQESVDDVIPIGDLENMAPHAHDDLGASADLIEKGDPRERGLTVAGACVRFVLDHEAVRDAVNDFIAAGTNQLYADPP